MPRRPCARVLPVLRCGDVLRVDLRELRLDVADGLGSQIVGPTDLLLRAFELGRAGEVLVAHRLAFAVAAGLGFEPFGLALAFAVDVGAVDLDGFLVAAGVVDVVLCHFNQLLGWGGVCLIAIV